jgi:tetratricopeptide (TPR) repeat protein
MMARRSRVALEQAIERARTKRERALAYHHVAVFHDNNLREAEAIPHYRRALALGLDKATRARALAWLASSLYKTGQPKAALRSIAQASQLGEPALEQFLARLKRRVERQDRSRAS